MVLWLMLNRGMQGVILFVMLALCVSTVLVQINIRWSDTNGCYKGGSGICVAGCVICFYVFW